MKRLLREHRLREHDRQDDVAPENDGHGPQPQPEGQEPKLADLAIPSVLIIAVGIFALVGDPWAANALVAKLGGILPGQAQSLLRDSLATLTQNKGTGVSPRTLLALWSVTGAMQNVMWGLNVAYERNESRGFVRRRITALTMVGFAALGVLLLFGMLVLGPHMVKWIGDATGETTLVSWKKTNHNASAHDRGSSTPALSLCGGRRSSSLRVCSISS